MNLFAPNLADCYKVGHAPMYHDGTGFLYSNLTPRSSRLFRGSSSYDDKMVVFGIQAFNKEILQETWNNSFFNVKKEVAIKRYKRRMAGIFGPDVIDMSRMEQLHDLGYLPLLIRSLPEGARVGMKVPIMTIQNTHEDFAWLVNYVESILSAYLWKMCTTATTAYEYRRTFDKFAKETSGNDFFTAIQGHDFSFRGMSGPEDAARCGAGHLLSFVGTDTIPAIDFLEDYYLANTDVEMVGISVAATEHSVSSSNILFILRELESNGSYKGTEVGKFGFDNRLLAEYCFMKELLEKYPTGIISYVADTYDFWSVVTKVVPALKEEILARQPDAVGLNKLVLRPDSGDPVEILCGVQFKTANSVDEAVEFLSDEVAKNTPHGECGDSLAFGSFNINGTNFSVCIEIEWNRHDKRFYYMDGYKVTSVTEFVPTAEQKGAVESLWDIFGGTEVNGYKVLDSHIGLIYGDAITLQRQEMILSQLKEKGFGSDNIVLGIGSYTYQHVTRDSLGTAMKATATKVNGELIEIYKDPMTGDGNKKSAKGFMRVEIVDGEYVMYDQQDENDIGVGEMKVTFYNGMVKNETSLEEIRNRLKNS